MHCEIGFVSAVHADHAEEMRISSGKCPKPHQSQGAWCIGQPHELGKASTSFEPRIDQPAAAIEQGPLRAPDHLDRLAHPGRIGSELWAVTLMTHFFGGAVRARRE